MSPLRKPKNKKLEFADVCNWESVFRYKGTALLVFILGIGATLSFLWLRDRSFESKAKVFVRIGRESVTVDPTAVASGQMLQMTDSQKREIQSAIDILESEQMLTYLVDQFGTDKLLGKKNATADEKYTALVEFKRWWVKTRQQLVQWKLIEPKNEKSTAMTRLKKRISVKSEADSNVLSLGIQSDSPELSQSLANSMLQKFQELHLQAHRAPGAYSFFTDQLERTRKEISDLSKQLSASKNQQSITSVDDKREVLSEKLKAIEIALLSARGEHVANMAKTQELDMAVESMPEKLVSSEVVGLTNTSKDDMRSKLYSLELELADLSSSYQKEHPLVVRKSQQLEEAKKVLATESPAPQKTTSNNPSRETFVVQKMLSKADSASAKARSAELESQFQSLLEDVRSLNEQEAEVEALERDLTVLKTKFHKYSDSLEQSRIDDALNAERLSSINVIQAPTLDEAPVDVSNTIVSLGGVFLSLIAAIGSTFALRYLRDEMLTAEDIERELKLPVLATVPAGRERQLQST